MITGFEAYNIFQSIKMHFTSDAFDCREYDYSVRSSIESFNKRKDAAMFTKAAKKYASRELLIDYFLSNIILDPANCWISTCNQNNYLDWKRRIEGLTFIFENECKGLVKRFPDHTLLFQGSPPNILNEYLGQRISLETLVIFNSIVFTIDNYDDASGLFSDIKRVVKKYYQFLNIDKLKMAKIAHDVFKAAS